MIYDKQTFLNNIRFLSKARGINLGDIEKRAGVSTGYISRISKDENKGNPPIDFVVNVADQLKTSVDAIVSVDYSALTATEEYIANFIKKLTNDTSTRDLPWKKERKAMLDSIEFDQNGEPTHPLFESYEEYQNDTTTGYPTPISKIRYNSHFFDNNLVDFLEDGYTVSLDSGGIVYLMCIEVFQSEQEALPTAEYEMYMVKNFRATPVCASSFGGGASPFNELLKKCYFAAEESCKHAKIDPNIRNIIDGFMNDTGAIDDDDLPF